MADAQGPDGPSTTAAERNGPPAGTESATRAGADAPGLVRPEPATYSVFVQYRSRRLTMRRHLPTLDHAVALARELRNLRFHDRDHVLVIDDRSGEVVRDTTEPRSERGAAREDVGPAGTERSSAPEPGRRRAASEGARLSRSGASHPAAELARAARLAEDAYDQQLAAVDRHLERMRRAGAPEAGIAALAAAREEMRQAFRLAIRSSREALAVLERDG